MSFTIQNHAYLNLIFQWLSYLGNGAFFFVSGYLLRNSSLIQFYEKRLYRIYPLYLVAVAIATWKWGATLHDLIIHLFGLQMIIKPTVELPVLWFVSAIFLFYLLYPFITRDTPIETLIASATIFGAFLLLRAIIGIFDFRIFLYFIPFTIGIVFQQAEILKKVPFALSASILLPTSIYFLIKFQTWQSFGEGEIGFYVILGAMMVAFCCSMYSISQGISTKIIEKIAIGSYPVFLFHFPILYFYLDLAIHHIGNTLATALAYIVLLPIVLVGGYYVQKIEDILKNSIYKYRQ